MSSSVSFVSPGAFVDGSENCQATLSHLVETPSSWLKRDNCPWKRGRPSLGICYPPWSIFGQCGLLSSIFGHMCGCPSVDWWAPQTQPKAVSWLERVKRRARSSKRAGATHRLCGEASVELRPWPAIHPSGDWSDIMEGLFLLLLWKGISGWTDLHLCAGRGWLLVGGKMYHDLDREEETSFSRKTTMGLSTTSREIRTEECKVPMLFKVP